MGQKRYTPEQIIGKLRQAEVRSAEGKRVAEIVRELGITEQTYYRWRREYGGLKVTQAKRLKELERENGRLKQAVADLTLDKDKKENWIQTIPGQGWWVYLRFYAPTKAYFDKSWSIGGDFEKID